MPLQLMLIVNLSIPSSPVTSLHVGHHDQKDLKLRFEMVEKSIEWASKQDVPVLRGPDDKVNFFFEHVLWCTLADGQAAVIQLFMGQVRATCMCSTWHKIKTMKTLYAVWWGAMFWSSIQLLLDIYGISEGMFESLISNLMQSDTVVIDFWMIKCTLLYLISKQGWLAGFWFCCERSCLPLSLPLTALSSVSFAKIQYFPACCEFVYVCVCSEDVQFECFSSSALSGWRTAVFCRWGLWIGIFSIPAPTHSPTHANTGTNLTLFHWAD